MSTTAAGPAGGRPRAQAAPAAGRAFYHPTVARLTYRGLLGRRRGLLLLALPLLMLLIVSAVRLLAGQDDTTAAHVLQGFALSTMVPLIGVIAGTGAIGPEIDEGAIVYLLSKPIRRSTIITTKLMVTMAVTVVFCAVPTLIAGVVLNGGGQSLAVAFAAAAAVAAIAYAAIFLMLSVVTRHAVVVGLVYALVWEGVVGNVVPGARTLSVQQWSLALAQRISDHGQNPAVTSDVSLATGVVMLIVVTAAAAWFAVRKLRTLAIAGEE